MAGEIDLKKGIVTWFDVRRGYGFITPEEGGENVFVHQSSIKAVGYRSLAVGDAVEFVVSVGDDGRRRAVSITGPGGNYINGRRYFRGACYRCGEVGHMAINCKSVVAGRRVGPCFNCGVMGHLSRECSYPRFFMLESSDYITEEEEEEEEEEEISDDDREFQRGVEERNWAELPRDVLSMIFKKITAVEIIRSAQYVCRPWRQLSYEPELWRHIVVTTPDDYMDMSALASLAILAVDRSEGCVEDFQLKGFTCRKTEELIGSISNRTTKLRRLRLIAIGHMFETALAQAIRKFPLLEELEISFCSFSFELIEVIGPACSQLKSFKFNVQPGDYLDDYDKDSETSSIAKHMQQLQHLELIGNCLTNIGLLAILNNCPNLQSLDIRACYNVKFDEDLKRKCANIKELRHPEDSISDFELRSFISHPVAFDANYYDEGLDEFETGYDDFEYYDDEGFSDMSYDDMMQLCCLQEHE